MRGVVSVWTAIWRRLPVTHSSCSVVILFSIDGQETSFMYALVLRSRSLNCKYLILTDIFCVKHRFCFVFFINKDGSIYITR